MGADELIKLIRRVPFRRFDLLVDNGRRVYVDHPENIFVHKEEGLVLVVGKEESFEGEIEHISGTAWARRRPRRNHRKS